jgi:shikimate kinase
LTGSRSFVDEIAEVLAERLPKYQAAADWTVATEGLTVNQVAEQILSQIPGSSG